MRRGLRLIVVLRVVGGRKVPDTSTWSSKQLCRAVPIDPVLARSEVTRRHDGIVGAVVVVVLVVAVAVAVAVTVAVAVVDIVVAVVVVVVVVVVVAVVVVVVATRRSTRP